MLFFVYLIQTDRQLFAVQFKDLDFLSTVIFYISMFRNIETYILYTVKSLVIAL